MFCLLRYCYQFRKDNSTRNKDILDPDVLEHLQDVQELLKKELKSSRFFSISTFLESVKRIRGDGDTNSYDKNFINQILDSRGDEQLRLINKDRNTLRITGLIENKTSSEMEKIYAKIDSLSKSFPPYLSLNARAQLLLL